jgi:quercetin dioxygenase-like cupin family protein
MKYRTHEDGPLTSIEIGVGCVIVTMDFDHPGAYARPHRHTFDHWSHCVSGSARVLLDGKELILRAGEKAMVPAHALHGVWALESGTVVRCEHESEEIHPDKATDGIPLEWLDRLTELDHAIG